MRAPLSVILPTLNSAVTLGPVLGALWEGVEAGLVREVIFADGGSTDATAEIAHELGATLVAGPPGRGGQLARGVAAASGPWLMILHSDTVPAPGWAAAVRAHMRDRPDAAGYFRLEFDAPGLAPRLVAGWANLRARLFALPYGDQGLVMARGVCAAAGGIPEIPLMEDVALARRLGRRRLAPIAAAARTSASRYLAEGWLRRGARNLWTLARYAMGAPPERLARGYRRADQSADRRSRS
jgi:rSAM/selenodomain-associated transferase 2